MTRFRRIRNIVLAAAFSAVAFSLASCAAGSPVLSNLPSASTGPAASPVASPTATPDPTGVLLTVSTRGGHCVDGPCGTTVVIDRDGRVHFAAKPPNELGVLSPELMATLEEAIRTTDYTELFSHPFTGECPTAYDGQEIVFEIAAPTGIQRIASCQVEVDYDAALFAAVLEAVGEFVPFPAP